MVPAFLLASFACAPVPSFTDPRGPGLSVRYAPARADTSASPASIRVVTFNVKFVENLDGAIAVPRETPELRGADLIALQEMDDRRADWIARAQRRIATGAEVLVGSRRVRAYSVHLEMPLRLSEGKRRDQARARLDDAGAWPGPVVVAGDMNYDKIGKFFESRG